MKALKARLSRLSPKAYAKAALAAVVVTATAAANAAITVDLTPVTGAQTAVETVGAAVFALYVSIKLYKWIRRAL